MFLLIVTLSENAVLIFFKKVSKLDINTTSIFSFFDYCYNKKRSSAQYLLAKFFLPLVNVTSFKTFKHIIGNMSLPQYRETSSSNFSKFTFL